MAAADLERVGRAGRDRLAHVSSSKITVVHHGLSERFRPVEEPAAIATVLDRYGLRGTETRRHGDTETPCGYFLYVGTVQPRKNLVRLIEAFARIAQATDGNLQSAICNLQLVIAGKRGWLTDSIERRVAELGIAERVRFTGYVADEDLPALLSGALAFVFPSLYEGFGMPVLEAMACGAPVLASATSALPEVAGDAALLIDPEDTAAIAHGLERLAGDADLRADLRARGLVRAAQFTWERCAEETLAVLVGR